MSFRLTSGVCSVLQIFEENYRWASDHFAPNLSPWTGLSWRDFGGASAWPPSKFSSQAAPQKPGGWTSCEELQQTWLLPPRKKPCEAFLELPCPPLLCTSYFCRLNLSHFLNVNSFTTVENLCLWSQNFLLAKLHFQGNFCPSQLTIEHLPSGNIISLSGQFLPFSIDYR